MIDLEAIKKQLGEISPWPWKDDEDYVKNALDIYKNGKDPTDGFNNTSVCIFNCSCCTNNNEPFDKAFIAQAPALLAACVEEIAVSREIQKSLLRRIDFIEAENKQLREELEANHD